MSVKKASSKTEKKSVTPSKAKRSLFTRRAAPSGAPRVALLGRPNVGKSTLFNRLIRSKRAITHDMPGVTRDRMEGWVRNADERPFILIDTGGITMNSHSLPTEGPDGIRGFESFILEQAKEAIAESAVLCLVVDGRDGLTPFDSHLADFLRRSGKPVLVVVNKVDGPEKADIMMAEFHALGLEMLPCSAAHGFHVRELEDELRNRLPAPLPGEAWGDAVDALDALDALDVIGEDAEALLDALLNGEAPEEACAAENAENAAEEDDAEGLSDAEGQLPAAPEDAEEIAPEGEERFAEPLPKEFHELKPEGAPLPQKEKPKYAMDLRNVPLRLAMLGRPNVGKSSIVNALVGKERMIVSDKPGSTRDSVDVPWQLEGFQCTLVDSAGVRRPAKIQDTVERYSVNSSLKSSSKAQVTLLVLDAVEGLTQQDKRLLDLLNERKTPFMVLVNKCDLVDAKKLKTMEKDYKEAMAFCQHVPLLMVSAKTGRNLKRIVSLAKQIRQEGQIRIGTSRLNRTLAELVSQKQPPMVKNLRPKFYYATQAESAPPTFVCFVNDPERIKDSYARYLERALREWLGIKHAPMRLHFRPAHNKKK